MCQRWGGSVNAYFGLCFLFVPLPPQSPFKVTHHTKVEGRTTRGKGAVNNLLQTVRVSERESERERERDKERERERERDRVSAIALAVSNLTHCKAKATTSNMLIRLSKHY